MTTLYHWTRDPQSAGSIDARGFEDTGFDAVDGCGSCTGVWVSTHPTLHRGFSTIRYTIDVPEAVLAASVSSGNGTGTVDYVIPAALLDTYPRHRTHMDP